MKALVTGASGFVGQALCRYLVEHGFEVRAAVRREKDILPDCETVVVGEIGPDTDWRHALERIDVVAHLAARAHVVHERSADPMADFRRVNVQGTIALARAAAAAGVRRLVFLSTVKVHGESSTHPFSEADAAQPQDAYAVSKWEAEQALTEFAGETGLEYVILRPPLVYGPGVKANFRRLMQAVACGLPLPLACARNLRSLIYLGNLVDAIRVCLTHPAAANRRYLVADGEDLSTAQLIRRLAAALKLPVRLWPVPVGLLRFAAAVVGRRGVTDRLFGSLQVEGAALRRDTGWHPPFEVDEGLTQTARDLAARDLRTNRR